MKRLTNILFAGSLAIIFTGCSKFLDKLDDPNLVTNPPLNGLLAEATFETGRDVFRMGNVTSYYTQYLASYVQGSDADIYNEVNYSTAWTNFYQTMMNIKQMNIRAADQGATLHLGVGKILMAYNLNMLINAFGDVPFSQALLGQEQLIPGYDNQTALYDSTLSLLDQGIAELNKPNPLLVLDERSDVIHGGSVSAWLKTAYALKARFLNQHSKKSTYNTTNILTALGNAYTSNADDAMLTAFEGRSPWNAVAYNNTQLNLDGWLSSNVVDAMNGNIYGVFDPRLPLIASITRYDDYRGTRNGAGRIGSGSNSDESYLWVDGYYSKGGAPVLMITYSEMKFIEAEVAMRDGDPQTAYTAYLEGIRANMEKLEVEEADINTYLSNPAVAVGQGNISLELIFKEKYVALFLNPETWVDMRRFDYQYQGFQLPLGAVMNTFIRRLAYPSVEISRNGANVPDISGLDEKLYFDQP